MEIYGIEKLSLVDYDGYLCCTLFTKKCNFRCPFCHNSQLITDNDYEEIAHDEIFDYLKLRKNMLDAVCISGGEPTLETDLVPFIKQIKELGYLVKLDTNGSNFEVVKALIDNKLIDYIAVDIKNSLDKYEVTTNIKNINLDNVVKTINYIIHGNINYEFRTTLVAEFHDQESIMKIASLIKGAKKYALQRFENNDKCFMPSLHAISEKKALEYQSLMLKYIDNVILRGY